MGRHKVTILLLAFSWWGGASPPPTEWIAAAHHLTGESQAIRQRGIERLRAITGLPAQLRTELSGPHRYLALDVITALQLKELLPDLKKATERDEDGAVYLAINSLLDDRNVPEIARLYRERLEQVPSRSFPVQVILLETLGRMGVVLSPGELGSFLQSPSYEVRMAVVSSLRPLLLRDRRGSYLPLLGNALGMSPYQLRLQALFLIGELPPVLRNVADPYLTFCEKDANEAVRSQCHDLKGGRH